MFRAIPCEWVAARRFPVRLRQRNDPERISGRNDHMNEGKGRRVVQYGEVVEMSSYRSGIPQVADPLEHIYKLERELEMAEKRTASMIEDLARRLAQLETRMSAVTQGLDQSSRKLEREIVALSDRLTTLEIDKAA